MVGPVAFRGAACTPGFKLLGTWLHTFPEITENTLAPAAGPFGPDRPPYVVPLRNPHPQSPRTAPLGEVFKAGGCS